MTDAVRQLRRTYRGEEDWFPLLEEHGHRKLRAGLIRSGVTPVVAGQLVWFLDDQRHLDRHLDKASGVRYRRILRDLDPESVSRAIPRQSNWTRRAA